MNDIEKLINGYKRFLSQDFEKQKKLYHNLSEEGQSPKILIISCCDSRVHPEQIMDTKPGDIFVIRNVANLVPVNKPDGKSHGTSAAVEFAVKHLKVRHIIVLGHSQCGGIKALMEGEHPGDGYGFVDPWMGIAKNAREKVLKEHKDKSFDDQCSYCEKASIEISLNNLLTFPWIKEKRDSDKLTLHGWYFDIKTGSLLWEHDGQSLSVEDCVL